jgi:hypothetical protein
VRPADVYLATVDGRVELVGIDVGVRTLLRRLGPKRLRSRLQLCRPSPAGYDHRVRGWGSQRNPDAVEPARRE